MKSNINVSEEKVIQLRDRKESSFKEGLEYGLKHLIGNHDSLVTVLSEFKAIIDPLNNLDEKSEMPLLSSMFDELKNKVQDLKKKKKITNIEADEINDLFDFLVYYIKIEPIPGLKYVAILHQEIFNLLEKISSNEFRFQDKKTHTKEVKAAQKKMSKEADKKIISHPGSGLQSKDEMELNPTLARAMLVLIESIVLAICLGLISINLYNRFAPNALTPWQFSLSIGVSFIVPLIIDSVIVSITKKTLFTHLFSKIAILILRCVDRNESQVTPSVSNENHIESSSTYARTLNEIRTNSNSNDFLVSETLNQERISAPQDSETISTELSPELESILVETTLQTDEDGLQAIRQLNRN